MPTVIIDPGHGGMDPGAVYKGRQEKDDNLRLALAVGELLSQNGVDVLYTRTDDVYDSPYRKAMIANESGADYLISFHRNASPIAGNASGIETLVYADRGVAAQMARDINRELAALGFRDIGVIERPGLAVLRRSRMPAVLIETGFIDNDADNLKFDEEFEEIAAAMGRLIKEGVIRAWGMSQVDVNILAKAHAVTPVAAVQNLYSMLERDCEKDIFPYCLEHNIGVVPFSPIASGFLSGKIKADTQFEAVDDVRKFVPQLSRENIIANQPVLDILAEYSAKKNATNAQISLAWMLHKYPNVVPIPGSKNQERILENLGAADVELTDEEFRALEAALDACTIHGHRGHVETEQANFGNNWKRANK